MDKLGVFLCTGCGIGEAIDVDEVIEAADEHGCACTLTHECFCGTEGLEAIKNTVSENDLNGILVAACSERAKNKEFAALTVDGPSIFRTAIREYCAWPLKDAEEDEDKTACAKDMVQMGLARLDGVKAIEPLSEEISDTVMVVGSGRAGLEAALTAAGLGHPVVLVEKDDKLGGLLADQKSIPPEEPPYEQPEANPVPKLIEEIEASDKIKVLTTTNIVKIDGQPGQLKVQLNGSSGLEMTIGSIVQATGAKPYDASKLDHLGYGASPDVVTSQDLEAMLVAGKIACPSDGRTPKRIAYIQCAGSRDKNHLEYCSSECCNNTLRQMMEVSKIDKSIENAVIYKDIRSPGQMEYFFLSAQKEAAGMMTRGDVEKVTANGQLKVHVANSMLGDKVEIDADLVVLAVGMVPNSADGELIRELIDSRHQAENSESSQVRETSAARAAVF
jgi:quinone-modifying oxidoreductase subunit QmoB